MNFKNKVVLITGASSGIGAATAVYFASLGAKLSLTGRSEDNLKKTVEKCKKENRQCEPFYVVGDMSKVEDVTNILKQTIEKFGHLDVLVNNAGTGIAEELENMSLENYDQTMNTNLRGVLWLTKLAMPYLLKSKGNVVNISSASAIRPFRGNLAYDMSKAALDQFTKCVALEVASKQVRVNSVNPGAVVTNILNYLNEIVPGGADAAWEDIAKHLPLGRNGKDTEIAAAIAFLASDLASNITGVLLPCDGGAVIAPPQ